MGEIQSCGGGFRGLNYLIKYFSKFAKIEEKKRFAKLTQKKVLIDNKYYTQVSKLR